MKVFLLLFLQKKKGLLGASGPCRVHQFAELGDDGGKTFKNGLADYEVADVEFDDFGDGGDGRDVGVGEAVAGVDFEAEGFGEVRTFGEADEFVGVACFRAVGVGAGVEFDDVRADVGGGAELVFVGVNEE